MNPKYFFRGLLFCDLDDTLISGGAPVSPENAAVMRELENAGIGVVVASGRNLPLLERVLPETLPVRFAICSTGAGILSWPERKLLRRRELSPQEAADAARRLRAAGTDFMVYAPLPENHRCRCCAAERPGGARADFYRRLYRFPQDQRPLPQEWDGENGACQLLAIFESNEEREAERLAVELRPHYSVVRATSPLDHQSIWLEIFAPGVNKASAAAWLREHTAPGTPSYALGNDYNDLELLEWADFSLLAPAAPEPLKRRYESLTSPPESILREAARKWSLI